MKNRRSPFIHALGPLAIVALLFCAGPIAAIADDSIDDAKQPHLKAWSNIIPTAKRFVVLADFNNEAVLDRETGLVWEQSPSSSRDDIKSWKDARLTCANKSVGRRQGWRLPSIIEFASLIDPSIPSPGLSLPVGHPFNAQTSVRYWSATSSAADEAPPNAWVMYVSGGMVQVEPKTNFRSIWCVRGPMNADAY